MMQASDLAQPKPAGNNLRTDDETPKLPSPTIPGNMDTLTIGVIVAIGLYLWYAK